LRFLTNENELHQNTEGLIYFYSSDSSFSGELMFPVLTKLNETYNITCIDIQYFKGLSKRFNIKELPTILQLKNNIEIKRITGFKSINNISKILENDR